MAKGINTLILKITVIVKELLYSHFTLPNIIMLCAQSLLLVFAFTQDRDLFSGSQSLQ